jgi:hypothetical protein
MISSFLAPRSRFVTNNSDGSPGSCEKGWGQGTSSFLDSLMTDFEQVFNKIDDDDADTNAGVERTNRGNEDTQRIRNWNLNILLSFG